jgi:hypothetical protein
MNEIISFQSCKQTILRDAIEKAEAKVDRLVAEVARLERNGAPYSDQLRASMELDRARLAYRNRERAFARFCGAESDGPEDDGVGRELGQVIALTR